MTNHFMQFIVGFSYSFPVITINNKYQTLREREKKHSDKQNSNKISNSHIAPKSKLLALA